MRFVLTAFSRILFHILYTLRRPVQWALRGLAGVSMFAFFFCLFHAVRAEVGQGWAPAIAMLVISVVSGALAWQYDALLLRLCPPGYRLTLYG